MSPDEPLPDEVDLLVIGAGAAGMTTALVASLEGLQSLLCEKSSMVGGTTSTSAGTVWIPGSSQSERDGVPDTVEAARKYMRAVVGDAPGVKLREAFLEFGREAIDYLEARSDVKFVAAKIHPDYKSNQPGAALGGRALAALPYDGRLLGLDFDRVRPPRREFMILGGMMVAKDDIPHLVKPFSSASALANVLRLVVRYGADRLRYRRGTRLVMGNALVARLFRSLRDRNVPITFQTKLQDLIFENGKVTGAALEVASQRKTVRTRLGVVLATGGIGWNTSLRARLFPPDAQAYSLSPRSNSGDGIAAGLRVGGVIEQELESAGLWMPCSILRKPDGNEAIFPHIVLDRAKPGLIAINKAGKRFTNEANSYHDFVQAMLHEGPAGKSVPAYLICDRSFITDYGIGLVHPGTGNLREFVRAGYLLEGISAADLASQLGVDRDALAETIAEHNRYAAAGMDEAFGRGSTDLNRVNGDPLNKPNPCMRPITTPPLFAVEVWPADLASSAGLDVDPDGQVLDEEGSPICGLFACGNDAASIFGGTYPGPGTTLGPALTFAWRLVHGLIRRKQRV